MLKSTFGVDFTNYKQTTINRRVSRRMVLRQIETLEDYVKYLRNNPGELQNLFNDLLIDVTKFFREPETFDILKEDVFRVILSDKSYKEPVKIWVPGCSTGEEVYSIAISLQEYLEDKRINIPVQIFGTDISQENIDRARSGMYSENITTDVSEERLIRFFHKTEEKYQINKSIRDNCIFAKQDMTKDPPFSNLDIISCRNVMIYFEPILKRKLISTFHYALKPTGFLILGSSEAIGSFTELFAPLNKKGNIYSKKKALSKVTFSTEALTFRPKIESAKKSEENILISLQRETNRIVTNKYVPAGVSSATIWKSSSSKGTQLLISRTSPAKQA